MKSSRPTPLWALRLVAVTVLVGIGGGVSGLVVSLSLHAIEHLAYGYSGESFLDGVMHSDPWRRVLALAIAGVVGGVGWWLLRRFGPSVVSIEKSVAGARMPPLTTVVNAGLQVAIVGLGASIGREVAPRELSALIAGWLSDTLKISARERRILVACGAGAGLAAVYNVPLSGAVFAIEVLLAELSLATALPALATAAIATLVARLVVPDAPLYPLPAFTVSPSVFVWALIVGPLMGCAALGFVSAAQRATRIRPRGWRILVVMPVVFTAVGLLAMALPSILGNGKALGDLAFGEVAGSGVAGSGVAGSGVAGGGVAGSLDGLATGAAGMPASGVIGMIGMIGMLAALALAKAAATTATIGAGAAGGTLTPSLAIGAALGAALGGAWSLLWPGAPLAAFAFIAAAAFLASSMRAPFTALILVLEFTGQGSPLLVPTMLAIAGSVSVGYLWRRRRIVGIA